MADSDRFQRFVFEGLGIRGQWVRLSSSWNAVLEQHPYPPVVAEQLGQALAAAVLLSATIKFRGSLILQAQGDGPLQTLVAQATHRRTIRGLAHWRGEVQGRSFPELFGDARLVMTLQREAADPYQGIVALTGANLAEAIGTYFARSEQLATGLWLAADRHSAAGLLLQELPSCHHLADDWARLIGQAGTVTEGELLSLSGPTLLGRLFPGEAVRLFEPEPVVFSCRCSQARIEDMLLALGREEIEPILGERGVVEIDCEFCNRRYRFDEVDIGALFTPQEIKGLPPPTRLQ